MGRSDIYRNIRNYDAAIADLDQAIAFISQANNEERNHYKKFSAAIIPLEQLFNNRALAKFQKGDVDDGIADLTEAIRLNSQISSVFVGRAVAYLSKGDYDAAIADCTECLRLSPGVADAYFYRGTAYRHKDDLERALKDCEQAILLNPKPKTEVYTERGWIKYLMGDDEGGIADCNKTLELIPTSPLAYHTRGIIYSGLHNWERAIEDYTRAIELHHPELHFSYEHRANSHFHSGNLEAALADYSTAIQLDPQSAATHNNRGYIYALNGDFEKALEDCNQAISINPQLVYAYSSRGFTYYLMRRYEDALTDFQKSAELKPDHSFAIAGQALSQQALGNMDKAKSLWTSLVQLDSRYRNANVLKEEYLCGDVFVEDARKLIAAL